MRNSQKAGRDANYITNNYQLTAESQDLIRSISVETFNSNFPVLIEVAKGVASERASALTENVIERIDSIENAVRNFQDPDFLFSLQDALKQYARHGGDELGNVVARVVADRASSNQKKHSLNSILGEACAVAPRLKVEQIEALSMLHILTKTRYPDVTTLNALNALYEKGLDVIFRGLEASKSSLFHLEYFGLLSVNRLHQKNLKRTIFTSYFDRDGYTIEQFMEDVKSYESLNSLIEWYEKSELQFAEITLVGQAIAIARIRNEFPSFEYDVWIN